MKGATEVDKPPATPLATWPELKEEACHGLVGEFLSFVGPHSEADPAALLFQYLAAFGASVGRGPHVAVEGDKHGANLFVGIIGDSAKARKGTSLGRVQQVFGIADLTLEGRTVSGLSSGEGLIWNVRDPLSSDDGAPIDKRLLAIESELAAPLKLAARDGNILSPILRCAWDGKVLQSLTKGSPAKATGAHIALIGHCTSVELKRHLTQLEVANGLGNRFLFVCARRSQLLAFGGNADPEALAGLGRSVGDAITTARTFGRVTMDGEAREIWAAVYPTLSASQPGMFGSLIARSEAQTLRLALIYALQDSSRQIRAEHLTAGLAAWRYAEHSVKFLFGSSLGDATTDRILEALRLANGSGLTRTQISGQFSGHASTAQLDVALAELRDAGLATPTTTPGKGRPTETWHHAG